MTEANSLASLGRNNELFYAQGTLQDDVTRVLISEFIPRRLFEKLDEESSAISVAYWFKGVTKHSNPSVNNCPTKLPRLISFQISVSTMQRTSWAQLPPDLFSRCSNVSGDCFQECWHLESDEKLPGLNFKYFITSNDQTPKRKIEWPIPPKWTHL